MFWRNVSQKFQIIAVSFILDPQNFIIYHFYMQWPALDIKEVVSIEILQIKILFSTRNKFCLFFVICYHTIYWHQQNVY